MDMTTIYWLLIFNENETMRTKLFDSKIAREAYICWYEPESYRVFEYQIETDYSIIDKQYI